MAFPWLVLQRNGSALDASIVAMAGTLPLLAATLIAGAAVDYLGRRRVSMISDALSALSVAAVPVLALTFGVDDHQCRRCWPLWPASARSSTRQG